MPTKVERMVGEISVDVFEWVEKFREEAIRFGSKSRTGKDYEEIAERLEQYDQIQGILGDDYDLDRLRDLVEADRDGRCVVVTRCCECENHVEFDGQHYCKFWRMYCPDDSEFYCKAAKDTLKGQKNG